MAVDKRGRKLPKGIRQRSNRFEGRFTYQYKEYSVHPSLGFSTRFFQNYILIDVIQVSINAGFFCCLKI